MPRARIDYRESTDQVTFTYRLPGRLFAPVAGIWCVIGGLAVGVGLALALVVAEMVDDPTQDPAGFRLALVAGMLAGSLALYALYARAVWRQRVRVAFDYAQNAITIRGLDARQRTIPFAHALSFWLDEQNQRTLVLETDNIGLVMLLELDQAGDEMQLAHFAGRLNANLTAIQAVPDDDIPPIPDELAAFTDELNDLSRITGTYDMPPDRYVSHHQPPE
jgi:hypothetical protein